MDNNYFATGQFIIETVIGLDVSFPGLFCESINLILLCLWTKALRLDSEDLDLFLILNVSVRVSGN